MYGVMRYRREDVVAILDTQRAGETHEGVPIVATVDDALRYDPTTALVGVVTQGGRFPADWRALLVSCARWYSRAGVPWTAKLRPKSKRNSSSSGHA